MASELTEAEKELNELEEHHRLAIQHAADQVEVLKLRNEVLAREEALQRNLQELENPEQLAIEQGLLETSNQIEDFVSPLHELEGLGDDDADPTEQEEAEDATTDNPIFEIELQRE